MPPRSGSTYRHTQKAPWHLLLVVVGVGMMVAVLLPGEPLWARLLLAVMGLLFLLLASSFRHLTVEDQGDSLEVRFGPLPLFRTRIRYATIREVEVGRTLWLDGWGIHLSLRGGWVWNIWGRDCVVIRHERGTLRVGTDDARNLDAFLKCRIET